MRQAQNQSVELKEFEMVCRERNSLRDQFEAAEADNVNLIEQIAHLEAQAAEARDHFQKQAEKMLIEIGALKKELKAAGENAGELAAELQKVTKERDDLKKELHDLQTWAEIIKATNAGLKVGNIELQKQIKDYEEVVERLKAQNSRFVEEQREAKQRADATAASLIKAKDEVTRLVRLADDFKERLKDVEREKNQVVEISNGFARERDEIRAEYDARGKVIKKLRKRLHKLKKKLKH